MKFGRKFNSPTFSVFEDRNDIPINGVGRLTASLLINGTSVLPTFRYIGGMATSTGWKPWGYGGADGNLTIKNGGVNAISASAGSPCLGPDDDSVLFNGDGGEYYQSPNLSLGDFGTNDLVIELVFKTPSSGSAVTQMLLDTRYVSTGIAIQWTSGYMNFYYQGTGGAASSFASTTQYTYDTWYHGIIFCDNSGFTQWYLNGVANGAATDVSGVASVISSDPLHLGSNRGSVWSSNLAYIAMWQKASWLDTHLQANLALDRFNQLTGVYPQVSKGDARPSVQTRATTAYIDKVERDGSTKLYQVGPGWLRCCSRVDTNGTRVQGYLAESAATNKCLYSEDFGDAGEATWTKTWSTIADNTAAGPNGDANFFDGFVPSTDAGVNHQVWQYITLTAAQWVLSAFFKDGDTAFDAVRFDMTDIANCNCEFDYTDGTVGTPGAGVIAAGVIDHGGGIYRFWMTFTGTAAAHPTRFYGQEAIGDSSYAGDASTTQFHIGGVQVELGSYPTSYIPTVGSAVTRNADLLRFVGDDGNVTNNKQGMISADVLAANYNSGDGWIMGFSDGGSSNERVALVFNAADNIRVLMQQGGTYNMDLYGTTDASDGVKHNIETSWSQSTGSLYVDGAWQAGKDYTLSPPDDLDRIYIGSDNGGLVNQPNAILSNLKIRDKPKK